MLLKAPFHVFSSFILLFGSDVGEFRKRFGLILYWLIGDLVESCYASGSLAWLPCLCIECLKVIHAVYSTWDMHLLCFNLVLMLAALLQLFVKNQFLYISNST